MAKKRSTKKKFMEEECCGSHEFKMDGYGVCSGGIYFLGFIGAAIYYIQTATSFGAGVLGFLKALVWPAFLIYKLLGL